MACWSCRPASTARRRATARPRWPGCAHCSARRSARRTRTAPERPMADRVPVISPEQAARAGRYDPAVIDRDRIAKLLERERSTFRERHPRSRTANRAAGTSLFGSVPMTWMNMAPGGFPVYLAQARGARVTDLDGHSYVDLCLGDTAAMAGHSPEPVVRAVLQRYGEAGGATAMLPTADATWVGAELARRFA